VARATAPDRLHALPTTTRDELRLGAGLERGVGAGLVDLAGGEAEWLGGARATPSVAMEFAAAAAIGTGAAAAIAIDEAVAGPGARSPASFRMDVEALESLESDTLAPLAGAVESPPSAHEATNTTNAALIATKPVIKVAIRDSCADRRRRC
jgi:hypothetical protein